MTSLTLCFYQLVISFGQVVDGRDDIQIQATKLNSKTIGEGLKIHSILSQFSENTDNSKAFETPNPKLKCVVQVINSKC
jgi:hypothetical protein